MDEQPEQWVGKRRGSGSPSDPVLRDSLLAGGQASRWAASYRGASVRVAKPDDRSGDCPALESGCGSFGQNAFDERLGDLALTGNVRFWQAPAFPAGSKRMNKCGFER